jgi:hypothetical protein
MADVPPATPATGGAALSPAVVGGRRHRMKKVSAKTIKRTLKRLGMKPKGRVVLRGGELDPAAGAPAPEAEGGRRRRRHTKKTHRRHRRSLFGLKY